MKKRIVEAMFVLVFAVTLGITACGTEASTEVAEKEKEKVNIERVIEEEQEESDDESGALDYLNDETVADTEDAKAEKGSDISKKTTVSESERKKTTTTASSNKSTSSSTTSSNKASSNRGSISNTVTSKPSTSTSNSKQEESDIDEPMHRHTYTEEIYKQKITSVPQYKTIIAHICKGCQQNLDEIIGPGSTNWDDHFYNHIINGEGSGWYSKTTRELIGVKEEVENVLIGYKCSCGDKQYF